MKSRATMAALLVAIAAQGVILGGMVVKAALPLWTGTEIRVKTTPIDPRSLFRGNYAQLAYDFSRVSRRAFTRPLPARVGDVVYVSLKRNEQGYHEMDQASLLEPGSGVYLRGRVRSLGASYRIHFGIEAFFAPKAEAIKLDRTLRRGGGIARLMVTSGGSVALVAVEPPPGRQ